MARSNLQNKFCEPPVDWFKALVLERINARPQYSMKKLADDSKINYSTLRKLMDKDTQDWSKEQRRAVCRVLHITEEQYKHTAHL